jgi:hypothetical protein
MSLEFVDDVFPLHGAFIQTPWKLKDLRQINKYIIALADIEGLRPPALGLACYSQAGELLWELKRWELYSPYVAVDTEPSLKAWSGDGWLHTIDVTSGEIVDRVFTK